MATHTISRSILYRPAKSLSSLFTRSFASSAPLAKTPASSLYTSSLLSRSRPLVAAISSALRGGLVSVKGLSTQATSSSLNDPNPNWSNRPPKETILLDGCDFEHWLVVVEQPEGDLTRDEIIDSYIKILAQIVGSEEEARMKIYSVSTRCYFAFGALVSEDLSHKLKELPKVRWVLPDSYLDVRNKDYGGEPFIDGKAVPYDPKYHEEWIRNNARANERNRRNDRPRNFDRSRNFERRRENMAGGPPPQRPPMGGPPPPPQMGGSSLPPPPPHMGLNYGGPPPPNNMGGQRPPPNYGGAPPQNNMGGQRPPPNYGGTPPPNYGGAPPANNMGGAPSANNMGGAPPPNYGGAPPPNYGGAPPPNYGGAPPPNYGGAPPPNYGGAPPQNNNYQQQSGGMQQPQYQNNYPPNRGGSGNPYQG
ncbi:Multiple organellar RNA editing factor 8, chloroplastic/mitochondrial [Cardamine amara subsp. amara]|uniref:Multiple organellar RNA editing factor 8, chloroplastic/mitochondrial n=1 Tax=Cardamine amara subsp. amara TaxID=228776 RepID=A0ABD1AEM0_CARAN